MQVIHRPAPVPLPAVDLAALPGAARAAEAERIAAAEARRPFDLERGPVLRLALLRLGEGEHTLLALMHHIVSDDWSVWVFVSELSALYAAFARGLPSPLPELPIGYGDFAPKTLLSRALAIAIGVCGVLFTALLAAVAVKALPLPDGRED